MSGSYPAPQMPQQAAPSPSQPVSQGAPPQALPAFLTGQQTLMGAAPPIASGPSSSPPPPQMPPQVSPAMSPNMANNLSLFGQSTQQPSMAAFLQSLQSRPATSMPPAPPGGLPPSGGLSPPLQAAQPQTINSLGQIPPTYHPPMSDQDMLQAALIAWLGNDTPSAASAVFAQSHPRVPGP